MKMDKEKIREEGIKIIEKFSKVLSGIKEEQSDATWYVVDLNMVTRSDAEGRDNCFRDKMKALAPKWEENSIKVDK